MNFPTHSQSESSAPMRPSPVFCCADPSESRHDLATRRETKFAIELADVGKLRRLIDVLGRRQVHNMAVSTVRSIYFDDAALSACHANLSGLGQRRKVRLRWYDRRLPDDEFWLEIKWRNSRVTGKHRARMTCRAPFADLSYAEITKGLLDAAPPILVPDLLANYQPIAIVEYRREHFASSDGRTRVTLDYDLVFYDQTGKLKPSLTFPYRMHNLIVLEGKTPIGGERDLHAFFFPFACRPTRCSKYVHACRCLGLIPGGN